MAGQPGTTASAIPAAASIVGNAFVNQYYNVLHQSPHVVHRFYTDESRLSRAEAGPNGAVDTAVTMLGIHDKVMSLEFGDIRAEIKTVDSQQSLTGSVLVMVTGALFSQSRVKRNFVQTFFLAPQEKGYFVLNDMFRYLDEELKPSQPLPPMANGIPEPPVSASTIPDQGVIESPPPQEHESLDYTPPEPEEEVSAEDHYDLLPEQVEVSELEDETVVDEVVSEHPEMPASMPIDPVASPVEEVFEEAPKKSYASILRVRKDGPGAPVTATQVAAPKVVPTYADRPTSSPPQAFQALPQLPTGTSSTTDHMDESATIDNEGDSRSVYVKNLPLNITPSELEEEFGKFGQLKPGGVNLRNQRLGVCFAFVEFEEPSSAQSAIEASPISISGRQVYVEEKRPIASRAGRGRFNPGRGYQNDGMRGRGYFGGRGIGRGGQDSEREFNRGRGAGTGRGGYGGGGSSYASNSSGPNFNNTGPNFNNTNGYRRSEMQNGNGLRPVRRGAGNPIGRNGPVARNESAVAAA